jgi:hypothetical protein
MSYVLSNGAFAGESSSETTSSVAVPDVVELSEDYRFIVKLNFI